MVNACETGSHRPTLVYLFNPSATFGGPQIPSSESGHLYCPPFVLPTFRVCISTLISNYKSHKCRVKHRDLIQFNRLALSFRIRTSPKLKNSLSGKHFTRYLSTHQLNPTLTNAADTDGWVLSNFYESYKTLSQLITNLFLVFPPPISKIAQISLGGITSPHTSPTTTPILVKRTIY